MRQFTFVFFLILSSTLSAQTTEQERIKHYNLESGIAIQGYDPVAYFKNYKAVKGNAQISTKYLGIIYLFSSEENKKSFLAQPMMFEPQYGGWCAFAMGDYGKKVEINPETFKIVDGKLYLFYNAYFNNTLSDWNKDESNLKSKADTNWSNFLR